MLKQKPPYLCSSRCRRRWWLIICLRDYKYHLLLRRSVPNVYCPENKSSFALPNKLFKFCIAQLEDLIEIKRRMTTVEKRVLKLNNGNKLWAQLNFTDQEINEIKDHGLTPEQVKSRKKLLESKNPTVAFRTAKDWKSGSRIIEAQEWFKY